MIDNNTEEFMDRQDEERIQIVADGEIWENKEIEDYKIVKTIRVEIQMTNQEMKKDLGWDFFLDLQRRVF